MVCVNIYKDNCFVVGGIMSKETMISKVKELNGDAVLHSNSYNIAVNHGNTETIDATGIRVTCK